MGRRKTKARGGPFFDRSFSINISPAQLRREEEDISIATRKLFIHPDLFFFFYKTKKEGRPTQIHSRILNVLYDYLGFVVGIQQVMLDLS